MHGGAGQEVLQTNGLRDAACQKGEKTEEPSPGSACAARWRAHITSYRHLLTVLSVCVCTMNVKTELVP